MAELLSDIELVIWSPRSEAEPPGVAATADALVAQDFRAELAQEVPLKTAFRRTIMAREGKDEQGNKVKASFVENGRLRGQLDRIVMDENTHRISRQFVGCWALREYSTGSWTVEGDGESAGMVTDELVRGKTAVYTWADVSGIVQAILKTEGMGAYSLRRSGGVYVCPTNGRAMLDRLGRFCEAIGLNLLRYDIPDTRAQRDEIAGAIFDSLMADCQAHEDALAGYTPEQTKPGIVENRRDAITETRRLADRLAVHLGERDMPLLERLDALTTRCVETLAAVQSHRPTQGGRRIAFAATS